jgi:glycosyltransferase involved in cell wall biosynthesis
MQANQIITVHKQNVSPKKPLISLILLDWSCRERFHALDWLSRQNVPRDHYEIIWVELYDRAVSEAIQKADCVITCHQKSLYHKHRGYNTGLLHARGQIITVCDSDAVFPENFIASIIQSFGLDHSEMPASIVLMHYQWRSSVQYPDGLFEISQLQLYPWAELWPNVGACMSATRADAIRFGGFDEHESFRGYLCGPYDLGWRLVNAGIPEIWHDPSVALYHFSHPDPPATYNQKFYWELAREEAFPHIDHHALTAVEAFSTGRMLPVKENSQIHRLRLGQRRIGTKFEERYSNLTGPEGFSTLALLRIRIKFLFSPYHRAVKFYFLNYGPLIFQRVLGEKKYMEASRWYKRLRDERRNRLAARDVGV